MTTSGARGGPTTIFLCGDVMTGRGIDQVLPHPSRPDIHEPVMTSALGYVRLAEQEHGRIPRPVEYAYVWGDALAELDEHAPDLRVANLETSITTSEDAEPKGINYRMHPHNVACLQAAKLDCVTLANNHVLDWGEGGLRETLRTLDDAGVAHAGAGVDSAGARRPAAVGSPAGRVLVFAVAAETSGVPPSWGAGPSGPGVSLLPDLSSAAADALAERIAGARRPGDLVVLSVHWGGNWGYDVPAEQRTFAHRLVDAGAVDVLFGHSSHHPKGAEVYRGRMVLYGCGDFINDYEGIGGYEEFRGELALGYFPTLDADGGLASLRMAPFRMRRFRLERAGGEDVEWLRARLDREARRLGTRVERADGALVLRW